MQQGYNVGITLDDQKKLQRFAEKFNEKFNNTSAGQDLDNLASAMVVAEQGLRQLGFIGRAVPEVDELGRHRIALEIERREDEHQHQILQSGVDIERKIYDANKMSSKKMKEAGLNTDLLQ